MDSAGGYFSGHNSQGIWIMNSDIKALLQIWSFQFFLSMGAVLSVAIALTIGVLLTHWIYLCARNIESKPTSSSFPKTILRLSGFQALIAGVALVPFIHHRSILSTYWPCVETASLYAFHPACQCPAYRCSTFEFRFSIMPMNGSQAWPRLLSISLH